MNVSIWPANKEEMFQIENNNKRKLIFVKIFLFFFYIWHQFVCCRPYWVQYFRSVIWFFIDYIIILFKLNHRYQIQI